MPRSSVLATVTSRPAIKKIKDAFTTELRTASFFADTHRYFTAVSRPRQVEYCRRIERAAATARAALLALGLDDTAIQEEMADCYDKVASGEPRSRYRIR